MSKTIKRALSLLLCAALLFGAASLLPLQASAEDTPTSGTCGKNLTWSLSDTDELIIRGIGTMTNYQTAPWYAFREQIKFVSIEDGVTSIGNKAFSGLTTVTSIILPDSVTMIGTQSFMNCTSLTSIRLSNNLISIGGWAFDGCTALLSITIPDSVTSIGDLAFSGCSGLTNVMIGISVKTIGSNVFAQCKGLNSVNIPDGVTSIGSFAFYSCSSLTDIVLPDSVISLGASAFAYCSGLSHVKLSNKLTTISNYLFQNCTGIKSITLPERITTIGESAFAGCIGLKSINLPDNISKIGVRAFSKCESLSSIVVPNKVTNIETSTFGGCKKLSSVTMWNNITNVGLAAFWNCPIKDVYFYGSEEDWNDIVIGSSNDSLLSATVHYLTYYTIQYNANGGTDAPANQIGYGNVTLSEIKPTRNGYTFLGWAINASATTPQYQPGMSYNLTNDVNLYAVWQKNEVILTSIAIKANPTKTTYTVGDTLNTAGLTLTATYSDNSTKTITSGFTCSPTKLDTAGFRTITVTYGGKTTTFGVTVNNPAPTQGKVKSVSVNDVSINYKSSTTLKPTVTADEGVKYSVKYESSNPNAVSVDNSGNVKGLKKGSATITCTLTDQYGNTVKDTCTVTVNYTAWQWVIIILLFGWIWY